MSQKVRKKGARKSKVNTIFLLKNKQMEEKR